MQCTNRKNKASHLSACFWPLILCLVLGMACEPPSSSSTALVVSTDLDHFWDAFDQITQLEDSLAQMQQLQERFIDQASWGQRKLFEVRNYTPQEYLQNIKRFPEFYTSLRTQMAKKVQIEKDIAQSLAQFRQVYPQMTEAKIYLGMGNFRTNATTVDSMVLFGFEMAFADTTINSSEFPESFQYFKDYLRENPIDQVDFLSIHEFVHTQQKEAIGTNLLSMALREGSAEWIAEQVSGKSSTSPALAYGKKYEAEIFRQFEQEMFNAWPSYWLWSNIPNAFGHRDLGYFVGYALSKHYYEQVADSQKAIADLIELDYSNPDSVLRFVDKLQYFDRSVVEMEAAFRQAQPVVQAVQRDGDLFTLHFSSPMDTRYRGFDFGPLGEANVLRISEYIGFGPDSMTLSFRATRKPEIQQQMTITSNFRDQSGRELKAYLIDLPPN